MTAITKKDVQFLRDELESLRFNVELEQDSEAKDVSRAASNCCEHLLDVIDILLDEIQELRKSA